MTKAKFYIRGNGEHKWVSIVNGYDHWWLSTSLQLIRPKQDEESYAASTFNSRRLAIAAMKKFAKVRKTGTNKYGVEMYVEV